MQKFDTTLFFLTQDSPSGPAYGVKSTDELDEKAAYYGEGAVTSRAGRIGQMLVSAILLSGFLYCWFML